ncbi:MAG: FtsW/RodA/SpoVE family cell cycle protein [Pontimonas sp.]
MSSSEPLPPAAPVTGRVVLKVRVPKRLRNLELGLLFFALGVNAVALALVQFGAQGALDLRVLSYTGGLAILVLLVHLAMRYLAPDGDPFVLPIATVINGLGITMIHRLDIAEGIVGWEATGIRQMAWTAVALVGFVLVLAIVRNHRVLLRFRYLFMLAGVVLLLMPLMPVIGRTVNGATLWVELGSITFQPGEVAKIALAIFFAGYLLTAKESLQVVGRQAFGLRWPRLRDLGPIVVVWAVAMAVLVFQRDLGTSLLYFGLFLAMMFIATERFIWIVVGGGLFLGGALIAGSQISYVQGRVAGWLNSFDPDVYEQLGGSYQLVQGLFGFAEGGFIGQGLGQGQPYLVPLADSDYIVASLGEELGLIGVFGLLALYLLLVSRGFRIGYVGTEDFGRLLASGLAVVMALQVFIVIGGLTRLIPVTGLTTPFLAAGGSSLVANWMIVALIVRLSDDSTKREHAIGASA